ncbi:MAG: molybdopterin-dependent oxidoreductase [Gordonibacter sp.]|uniref:molybdopterin-dependent oxidoreductase n=1 Tax=Gordonibacter sp. TaxID=1968902 RepID=UPI002FC78025
MQTYQRNIVAGTMVASLALGGAGTALAAETAKNENNAPESTAIKVAKECAAASTLISAAASEGIFTYDQTAITSNETIANLFRRATAALCGATDDFAASNPLEWKLSVSGDVDNAFSATVDELASEDSVKQVMTCTCGGNPADGGAIITADVKGIPVTHLLDRAKARAGVNTITFVSSDGTELSMPLSYVAGRHAVISYEINDEDLSASVGGNNQLWMSRTSANYFVRDIIEVRITSEKDVPAAPGEGAEYPNSPNVGIMSAAAE